MTVRPLQTLALLALLCAATASAELLDISLGFDTLPSAQGFAFTSSLYNGDPGAPESSVFSVGAGRLAMQGIGTGFGTAIYRLPVRISPDHAVQLRVTARCTAYEGFNFPEQLNGGAMAFVFANGVREYGFLITSTHVGWAQGGGWRVLDAEFDNTGFHDYLFDWAPGGVWQLYRDGVVVMAGAFATLSTGSQVRFGDLETGANANGEVSMLRLTQDRPTLAATTTWGRLKGLYR